MRKLPYLLIVFRLLLAPVMIWITYQQRDSARLLLVILLLLGLLSDIFDGIIARQLKVSNERLRRMDSQTDVVFWLSAGWCAWLLNPQIIAANRYAIAMVFVMEGLTYVFSFSKFGKETCTHAL